MSDVTQTVGITRFEGLTTPRARRWSNLNTRLAPNTPIIVCLCGSTRFYATFQEAGLRETLEGRIVLSIGAALKSDAEHFGHLPPDVVAAMKLRLDELHLRKIDLADEVLVLNVGGYIGPSTMRELAYAIDHGKTTRFWEAVPEDFLRQVPRFDELEVPTL